MYYYPHPNPSPKRRGAATHRIETVAPSSPRWDISAWCTRCEADDGGNDIEPPAGSGSAGGLDLVGGWKSSDWTGIVLY